MKALRWHGRRDVRLDDVPPPGELGAGDVLLDVLLCGVCGTDLEEYWHGPVAVPVLPHPLTGAHAPLTLGHEVLGRVVSVGPGVDGLAPGDRVVPDGLTSCGTCDACRAGTRTLCQRMASIGLHCDGGMAELLVVPAAGCVPIPATIPDIVAVLVEPLAVAVRAVRRAALEAGDRVLVLGAGTIGQCVARIAVGRVARVAAMDRDEQRVEVLLRAVPAVNKEVDQDPVGTADCVFDCAGSVSSFAAAMRAVAPGGRIVLVGAAAEVAFSPLAATLKEITVVTSLSHDLDLDTRPAVDLLARGEIDLSGLVTQVVPIDDAVATVFASEEPMAGMIKTAIDPTGGRA